MTALGLLLTAYGTGLVAGFVAWLIRKGVNS